MGTEQGRNRGLGTPAALGHELLEQARQRLRREAEHAPERWRPALLELADTIFERGLCLKALRRRHGLASARFSEQFRAEFGLDFKGYVGRWRLDTGLRLLEATPLHRWEAATLVGYAAGNSLGAARRKARRGDAHLSEAGQAHDVAPRPRKPPSAREERAFRQAECFAANEEGHAEIEKSLRTLYKLPSQPGPAAISDLEARLVSAWWEDLRWEPFEEQLRQVRGKFPFSTAAWFHHLQRLSREEGRADRRRGVELAMLALECLESVRSSFPPPEHAGLLAKAWLTLGNAHRLALDYTAAEEAFANADVLLGDVSAPVELRAELAWLRYELRRFQRRFAEALVHAEKAVAISGGNAALQAQALLRRGGAWWHLQRFDRAAVDYRSAAEEPRLAENPFLRCAALQGLADALVHQGDYVAARPPLEQAKRLAAQLGDRASIFHTRWVEGLLATRCNDPETGEKHLRAAREGFRALGDLGHFAVISLDLAEVLAATGHAKGCLAILAEALPHLEALQLDGAGLVALKLLAHATLESEIRLDLLEKVRASARLSPMTQPTSPEKTDR